MAHLPETTAIPSSPAGSRAGNPSPASRIGMVESYFDTHAKSWSDLYAQAQAVNDIVLADRKNAAVAHLSKHLAPGTRILDAGCGAGLATLDLSAKGFFVHGVDVSQKMLDCCAQNLAANGIEPTLYKLSRADLFNGELADESFDGIAALGLLQYQEDERQALAAFRRLLKPGGLLVVTGPSMTRLSNYFGGAALYYRLRAGLARRLRRPKAAPAQMTPPPAPPFIDKKNDHSLLPLISTHTYSPRHFRALLFAAGFEVLEVRGHGFVNFAIIKNKIGFRGELFLHRFFSRASKVLPIGQWANDIVAVARKPRD